MQLLASVFDELAAMTLGAIDAVLTAGEKLLKLYSVDVIEGYGAALTPCSLRGQVLSALLRRSDMR